MRRLDGTAAPAIRLPRWNVLLFLLVETLAVATMVGLLKLSRLTYQGFSGQYLTLPGEDFVLAVAAVLGELAMLRVVLRLERPMWGAMVMFGILSLFAFLVVSQVTPWFWPAAFAQLLAFWHLVVGILLLGAALLGGGRVASEPRGGSDCGAA